MAFRMGCSQNDSGVGNCSFTTARISANNRAGHSTAWIVNMGGFAISDLVKSWHGVRLPTSPCSQESETADFSSVVDKLRLIKLQSIHKRVFSNDA